MKTTIFCLLMLAFVAHADVANWAGTWQHATGGSADVCAPIGLLYVTQDNNGKTTVKGKWSDSDLCKIFGLAGKEIKRDGDVAKGQKLEMVFGTSNGTTLYVYLERDSKGGSTMNTKFTGSHATASSTGTMNLVKDTSKLKEWLGTYKFTLPEGSSDDCCLPTSFEVTMPEPSVYYSKGKYDDSANCKKAGVDGQEWDNIFFSPFSDALHQSFYLKNKKYAVNEVVRQSDGSITYVNSIGGKCKANVEKTYVEPEEPTNWVPYIIAIVVVVLILVAVGGYFIYRKKQAQRQGAQRLLPA